MTMALFRIELSFTNYKAYDVVASNQWEARDIAIDNCSNEDILDGIDIEVVGDEMLSTEPETVEGQVMFGGIYNN